MTKLKKKLQYNLDLRQIISDIQEKGRIFYSNNKYLESWYKMNRFYSLLVNFVFIVSFILIIYINILLFENQIILSYFLYLCLLFVLILSLCIIYSSRLLEKTETIVHNTMSSFIKVDNKLIIIGARPLNSSDDVILSYILVIILMVY